MRRRWTAAALAVGLVIVRMVVGAYAMQAGVPAAGPPVSSYLSVNEEDFRTVLARMRAAKAGIDKRQQELLAARYDLGDRAVAGATMSRGKAIQGGVRVKPPAGATWDTLAGMTPTRFVTRALSPPASCRCRTPTTPKAAWCSRSSSSTRPASRPAAT
jgi:hypothetical protein